MSTQEVQMPISEHGPFARAENMIDFDEGVCNDCGACLVKCPVHRLRAKEAKREFPLIRQGTSRRFPEDCFVCYACNTVCPRDARPTQLMIREKQRKAKRGFCGPKKLALSAHRLAWQLLAAEVLSEEERVLVRHWENPPKSPTLLLLGCAVSYISPFLVTSQLFDRLTPAGGLEFCCHSYYLHVGVVDQFALRTKTLYQKIEGLGAEEIVVFCSNCHLAHRRRVEQFTGAAPSYQVKSINEFLIERLRASRGNFQRLDLRAAVQRPCSFRNEPEMDAVVAELLDLLGVKIVDRQYQGENSLCTGAGGGISVYRPRFAAKLAARNAADAKAAGAEAMVAVSSCCAAQLAVECEKVGLPLYTTSELAQMAIGEQVQTGAHAARMRRLSTAYYSVRFITALPSLYRKSSYDEMVVGSRSHL